ncbi:30S ribosomal protein S12 methylthiotransferase RimO [Clostridiaceae bacterium M8S5]|nr:30S ribosomal protein S12 methylthiotransferase RimO [Clostridiaceae bacterium M8S5]
MNLTAALLSLGCSRNTIDSEIMIGILKDNNIQMVDDMSLANVIIINTCGFIHDAKEESIDEIIEATELRQEGKCKHLIVCGCLAQRYKDELMKEIPEIDAIIGTGNITEIYKVISKLQNAGKYFNIDNINSQYPENCKRELLTPNQYAYLKISQGCNNHCTYCIIPKLRGKYRSRSIEDIVSEAKFLVDSGVKEIILTAEDTGKYGIDIYGECKLDGLLDELNKIEGLNWIRLLYIYPETFTDGLIDSIKRNDKVLNYVDIPLQHINNRILSRMNRKTTKEDICRLIKKLRSQISDIIIRTTFITGFPSETKKEHEEVVQFIKEYRFDRLGVFVYSKEEGTKASLFDGQIDEETKKDRYNEIMEIQMNISDELNNKKVGNIYKVLIEEEINGENLYVGRTYMDCPDIDGVVYVSTKEKLAIGQFVDVKIIEHFEYDLKGVIPYELS